MSLIKLGGGVLRALGWITVATVIAASCGVALAQPASPEILEFTPAGPAPIIQSIAIRGNQRIEATTVGSYLPIQTGMSADPDLLDLSLKTLFNTGLFADVSLEMQPSGELVIDVTENPIVNQVIFEGNKRLKEEKIIEEIQLAARTIYTRAKIQADVRRIIELYRAKGRFAATVTPKVTPLEQNRIDVIFEMDEGPKTGIAKVNIVGNTVYTDNELRGEILTKESRWWRFFGSNSNYDPDRLEYERELLRQFYGRNGYADFSVVSSIAELTPDRKDFFITFTVDEGPKYEVGEVRVRTTLAKLDNNVLENFISIKSGQTFNSERVEGAVEAITFATGATGYAFVDVNPRLTRHPDSKTIDITFEVNEGPRVYVERINIKGNTRTLDKVIRREVRIAEGDPFNRVLVDRSKSRVRGLGFFKEVAIEEKPGSAPDRTELDVTVEEQSTGSLSVGVGVSSSENFIIDLSVEERNLLGRGQFLRFRVQASSRTRQVDIRFTQPYFLGRNLSAGASLFNQRTKFFDRFPDPNNPRAFTRNVFFIRDRIGGGVNTGFQISEYGRGGLSYTLTLDDVTIDRLGPRVIGVGDDPFSLLLPGALPTQVNFFDGGGASVASTSADAVVQQVIANRCDFIDEAFIGICASRGQFVTSLIGATVSFDTRDDPIKPRKGWRTALSVGFAGIGGDVNYYKGEATGAIYYPIIGDFIGALKGRAGYISGYGGDEIRLSDRFFEGASTFRGFDIAGLGPREIIGALGPNGVLVPRLDPRSGNVAARALGGKVYLIGSAEIQLPLPLPAEYGIRAVLFSDFGTVGLVDDTFKILNNDPTKFIDFDGDGIAETAPVQDGLALRMTAGVSVSWNSPFGPIRFDISKILRQEVYDQVKSFRFSAGTSF